MKEGWTIRTIGEVALHLCDGSHNPPVGIDFSEYPMLSSKNIFFDSYDYSEPRYLTKEQFDIENKRTNVSDGDMLLTIVGTIGRVCCIKEPFQPFTLQRSVAVIKPNKNIIISRYLMYCLCGLNAYFNKEAKGVAQKGIYLKQLSKISIPVPPLQEQERIVAELDLLAGIIDKQKQQLKELDTLAQSIFYDMFGNPVENEKGWHTEPLQLVAPQMPYKGAMEKKDGKVWLLNLDMVAQQTGEIIEKVFVEENKVGNSTMAFDTSNVLYSKLRPYLNKVVIPDGIGYGTTELVPLKPKESVLNRVYLAYLLRSGSFVNYISMKVAGAKMPRVSMVVLRDFPIALPPIVKQESFAKKIQSIESQKEFINRSIAESQKLFDYTMDKYFG